VGKKAAAHAIGTQGIINALKAGITTIEHGCYIDDEGIKLMVFAFYNLRQVSVSRHYLTITQLEKGAFLVPTLSAPYHIRCIQVDA
jgi:imidazolonepropionase-like amidohydrolase